MSDQFNRGGKNDGNRKYQSINLSQHFHKRDPKSAAKSTTGRGLQSLGKVGVSTRRLPRPAVCSSLKKENAGNDPNVALVPGGGGWGSKKEANQVEAAEGEKGWKDVEEKPVSKNSEFTQDFPSLGQEGTSDPLPPGSSHKLELRPQTVKWGEKQQKQPFYNVEEQGEGPPPPSTTLSAPPQHGYGLVHMAPVYSVVPGVYPGGAVYHPIYPATHLPPPATPGMYPSGTPPTTTLHLPYIYNAPPSNSTTEDKSKVGGPKGPDHWEDDVTKAVPPSAAAPAALPSTQPSVPPVIAPTTVGVPTSDKGYISPYTLPFPGTPGKAKEPEQLRAEPVGKPSTEHRITYHGRTSSHSSLSEPAEEEPGFLAEETESRDTNHDTSTQSRVLSRPTVKKELKAFPKEDEMDAKAGKDGEDLAISWDEDDMTTDKGASVWDERQKTQAGNVWHVSHPATEEKMERSSDRFFEDDYQAERHPRQYAPQRHSSYEESDVESRVTRDDRRTLQSNDQRSSSASSYNKPQDKPVEQPKLKQITIQQKPKVEILQKPPAPKPSAVQSVGAPSGNYWKEKQAEREKHEAEEERKRQEAEKFDAQRKRLDQYQDYRTPDQYSGSAFDEDQIRQYEDEREKRSIRRRGQDEFYDNDNPRNNDNDRSNDNDRNERPTRRPRRHREEVFRIDYREPRENHAPSHDSKPSRENRESRGSREKRLYNSEDRRDYQTRGPARDGDKMDLRDRRTGSRHGSGDKRGESRRRTDRNGYEDSSRFSYDNPDTQGRSKRSDRIRKPPKDEEKELFVEDTQADDITETIISAETIDPVKEFADTVVSEEEVDDQVVAIETDTKEEPVPTSDNDKYTRQRRNPQERYEKERYENPNFTTYRREPHSGQRERYYEFRQDQTKRDRRTKVRDKDNDSSIKSEDRKSLSSQKSRSEKSKSESKERRSRADRSSRHPREGQEWVQSKEPLPKSQSSNPSDVQSAETAERQEKGEASARRTRKMPSLRYYSANPADRLKTSQSLPSKSSSTEEKQKDRVPKSKSSTRNKDTKRDQPKKDVVEPKVLETATKAKTKDPSNEAKKVKKVDNTKYEMDRLKKMSQAGMDLLTLGIYAVDGKELDDQEADDFSEGFVEVVRKKSKKDPEPEKKPAAKSKKTKKSSASKNKKATVPPEEAKPASTATALPPSASSPTEKAPVKSSWVPETPSVDVSLMSNIWSNTKKNAWEKPLTFTEKQGLDTREILAPISGESSSLFSSDADLARKTKEKNWRGSDTRPPRFSKAPEQKTKNAEKKGKCHDLHIPGISGSALDLIPPVVEDLFGIRSDEEDDKPSLSSLVLESKMTSLVLDTKISAPAPPVVGLSQRSGTSQRPDRVPSSEELSSEDGACDLVSAETSTQTTPPAVRHVDKQTPPLPSAPPSLAPPLPVPLEGAAVSPPSLSINNPGLNPTPLAPPPLNLSSSLNPAPTNVPAISAVNVPINPPLAPSLNTPLNVSLNASLNPPLNNGLNPPLNNGLNPPLNASLNPPLNSALNPPINSALNPPLNVSLNAGPLNPTAVKQLITSTNNLSLTDQLREIGQSQLAAAQQNERAAHFFTVQDIQGSPLLQPTSQAVQTPVLPSECPLPTAAPFGHYVTPQDTSHMMSHQIGEKTPSLPLIGPHPISSTLSSLGAAVNRGTAGDMFKNYMSPISPAANKIYPLSSQAVQAAHFMSASHAPNYSPSMSPIPTQLNAAAFPRFHHKSTSPKLQGLYNTSKLQGGLYNSPQGSFEALDPTGMISFSHQLHKPANTNLTNQQLFYQRLVPGQDIYYKMKPPQNILLQSDMSKHVDAKPFNPGGHQPNQPMTNPRKAEIVVPHPMSKDQVRPPLHRPVQADFSAINGLMQQCLPQQTGGIQRAAIFPQTRQEPFIQQQQHQQQQQQQQQSVVAPHPVVTPILQTKSEVPTLPRSMPRVKLARDGRMHRVPDMRTNFLSLIPPAVQQHMQQQSLAQIQHFQEALARGEDPAAKETLPDNMKPTSKVAAATQPPRTEATERSLSNEESTDTAVVDTALPPTSECNEVAEESVQEPSKKEEEPVEVVPTAAQETEKNEKKAEKRKFAEVKSSYRRTRNQGYPPWDDYHNGRYHSDRYHGDHYHEDRYHDDRYHDDRYHDERYHEDRYYDERRYREERYGMRGGSRFGPPPMYRNYPPPPPPPRRRGVPPRHRDNGQY